MGGMFSVMKSREGLARDDYKDPGWYQHPAGTVAYEWTGETPVAERPQPLAQASGGTAKAPARLRARKPTGHSGH